MFSLLIVVWLCLVAALAVSALDYNDDSSFSRTVLGSVEIRVAQGLWWVMVLVLAIPIVAILIFDALNGGSLWMWLIGIVVVMALLFGISHVSNKNEAQVANQ